jgi:hypothetical protein
LDLKKLSLALTKKPASEEGFAIAAGGERRSAVAGSQNEKVLVVVQHAT